MATKVRERVENDAYGEMMARCIRAFGRRITDGNVEDIGRAVELNRLFDDVIGDAVRRLHDAGESWASIGAGAGVTRQAAQQRWGGAR